MKYYIGIDIGTSGTKSVLFNSKGQVCASSNYEYNIKSLQPGYAEENPKDWFDGVCYTLGEIKKQGVNNLVAGIGVSGQMHGLVLLDREDNILRDSIIWCDNRCEKQKEYILSKITEEQLKDITGNICMSAFTLAKLLWVEQNEPDIYAKIDKIMLPKDYIVYRLTGKHSADYSDCSGTQWLDIHSLEYADSILETFSINKKWLGELHESTALVGKVRNDFARKYDLNNAYVCAGGGDQVCGAVGCGVLESTDMSVVLGSSGVVFVPTKELYIAPNGEVQTFCHAKKGQYHIMGVTNACGTSLKWYKNTIDNLSYDELTMKASESPAGSNNTFYLPYLLGERTPHLDESATAMFFGLRNTTTKSDLCRSVLEGVSYSLKDCFSMIGEKPKRRVIISGGGAKSALWKEIIASMLDSTVATIQSDEGPALGAAIMAMVGTGQYKDLSCACEEIVLTSSVSEPNPQYKEVYERYYPIYKELYLNNKNTFKKLK